MDMMSILRNIASHLSGQSKWLQTRFYFYIIYLLEPAMSKKSSRNAWIEADMEKAINDVTHGQSIKGSACKYGMSEGLIRHRMKMAFKTAEEKRLAECIATMCTLGFSVQQKTKLKIC